MFIRNQASNVRRIENEAKNRDKSVNTIPFDIELLQLANSMSAKDIIAHVKDILLIELRSENNSKEEK